jgi:hypothetical protein
MGRGVAINRLFPSIQPQRGFCNDADGGPKACDLLRDDARGSKTAVEGVSPDVCFHGATTPTTPTSPAFDPLEAGVFREKLKRFARFAQLRVTQNAP